MKTCHVGKGHRGTAQSCDGEIARLCLLLTGPGSLQPRFRDLAQVLAADTANRLAVARTGGREAYGK